MTILITGSEGLIGCALRRYLDGKGFTTRGFDIRLGCDHPDCGDVRDVSSLQSAIKGSQGIVHFGRCVTRCLGAK